MSRMHRNSKDSEKILREFRRRQTRQIVAVASALFLVLFVAVLHRRPDIFGQFSRQALFAGQALVIASFVGFTFANWRCPNCSRHLGGDIIGRRSCRRCGVRLQ